MTVRLVGLRFTRLRLLFSFELLLCDNLSVCSHSNRTDMQLRAAHAGAGEALLTTLDMLLWSVVRGGVCEKWWWRGEGAVEKERLRGEVKSLSRASATRDARGVVW